MKKKITAICIICSCIITGCGNTSTPASQKGSNYESTSSFNINSYKDAISKAQTSIMDEAILCSNMGKYENSYWENLNKIGGSVDFNNLPEMAYNWLLEKGNITKETFEQNYININNQYKEIILIETDGKEASELENTYKNLYNAFISLYLLVTEPSGSLTSFTENYNNYVNAIKESDVTLTTLLSAYTNSSNEKHSETSVKTNDKSEKITTEKNTKLLPIEIKEFGYNLSNGYLNYGIILYNPNQTIAYDYPVFRISAYDSDGILLGTEDHTLSIIYPEQTLVEAFDYFKCVENPADVQVEVLDSEERNIRDVSTLNRPNHIPFEISYATKRDDKLVGEVINPNKDYDYSQVSVSVIFRNDNNKICGGNTTFINNVKAASTTPFEMELYGDYITDNFEVYANIGD